MSLDFSTLLWLQLASTLMSMGVLLSAIGPSAPAGLPFATLSTALLAPAYAFLILRDATPTASMLVANPLFWSSAVAMHRALSLFGGRTRLARWPLVLLVVATGGFTTLVWLGAPWGLRALVSTVIVAGMLVASCFELVRDGGLSREPARKVALALLGLASVGLLVRVALLVPRWAEENRPQPSDLQLALAHVPGLLVAQGFGMAFLLMHHQRVAAQATRAATTDALTGCANRRALEAQVRVELAHAARTKRSCSLVVVDLDHFKRVNDAHGHSVGDAVLVEAARALRGSVRPGDVVARYGGEEFCVLLREADLRAATVAAERLCHALRGLRFEADGKLVPIRASFGVAASNGGGDAEWEDLFRRADKALYQAKEQGRDRVVAEG